MTVYNCQGFGIKYKVSGLESTVRFEIQSMDQDLGSNPWWSSSSFSLFEHLRNSRGMRCKEEARLDKQVR
jgi:hypothetical protein